MLRALIYGVVLASMLPVNHWCLAETISVTVPGTANLWFADRPNGYTDGTDTAPLVLPSLVTGSSLVPGSIVNFSATGTVGYTSGNSPYGPEGFTTHIVGHDLGAQNGIATLSAPWCALVGVFLDSDAPSTSSAPSPIDFSSGYNFAGLSPQLKQPFYIGDGLTSTGSGQTQSFVVPTGATRLFLGILDSSGWYNNTGSFNVQVTVPEPSTLALMVGGFVCLLFCALRRLQSPQRNVRIFE